MLKIEHTNNNNFLYKGCPFKKMGKSNTVINVGSTNCIKCEHCYLKTDTHITCVYPKNKTTIEDKSGDLFPAIF